MLWHTTAQGRCGQFLAGKVPTSLAFYCCCPHFLFCKIQARPCHPYVHIVKSLLAFEKKAICNYSCIKKIKKLTTQMLINHL